MMQEYRFEWQPNNTEALHARLKEVFGERYINMDSSGEGLIFRFTEADINDEATLKTELAQHDPTAQTRRQERAGDKGGAIDRLNALDIDELRAKVRKPEYRDDLLLAILDVLEDLQKQFMSE